MAEGCLIDAEPRDENGSRSEVVLRKLVDKKETQAVFRDGNKLVSPAFALHYIKKGGTMPRYAIFMKKKYGIAVERNRAKRLVRAALFQLKDMIVGYHIILIPRRKMKTLGFLEIVGELQQTFCHAGLSRHG